MQCLHVSRLSDNFTVGQTLELDPCEDLRANHEGIKNFLDKFLPGGLSMHGKQQLLNRPKDSQIAVEFAFEQVRREYFPHLTSRFQSAFGFQNEDHLEEFANHSISQYLDIPEQIFDIWILESIASPHVGDMNLLSYGNASVHGLVNAQTYWSGKLAKFSLPEILIPLPVTVKKHVGKIVCYKKQNSHGQDTYGVTVHRG